MDGIPEKKKNELSTLAQEVGRIGKKYAQRS